MALGWEQNNPLLSLAERTRRCGVRLSKWDKITFGDVTRRIKATRDQIENLQKIQQTDDTIRESKFHQGELDKLLRHEEIFWFQRSRALWLKDGDKNTSFFHNKASQRRRRNTVTRIKN
ncbi:hypothetical protein ACS0TY_011537 [Phlomoides rotata]